MYFYSRPCGRGDVAFCDTCKTVGISTHAPAGGATDNACATLLSRLHFYSRPCGRGDGITDDAAAELSKFLLTPLREGRHPLVRRWAVAIIRISTHAPAGGATCVLAADDGPEAFLLTPLREGRRKAGQQRPHHPRDFYSRPCGRGDENVRLIRPVDEAPISTHAPAGGATVTSIPGNAEGTFLLTPLREGRRWRACGGLRPSASFLLTPLREGRRS